MGQSFITKRPRDWSRLVRDDVLQSLSGYVETVKLTVDVQLGSSGFVDWLTNNVAGVGVSISGVPAVMLFDEVASTFLKELGSNDSVLFFVCDQILHLILLLNLTELDSDRSWLISDKILEHSSGDVVLHQGEGSTLLVSGLTLGELDGDWGWLIGDEVLEHGGGNVVLHEGESGSLLVLGLTLSELDGDWGWLVSHQVLEHGSSDVVLFEKRPSTGKTVLLRPKPRSRRRRPKVASASKDSRSPTPSVVVLDLVWEECQEVEKTKQVLISFEEDFILN